MARTPLAGAVQDIVAAVAAGEERRTTRTRFVKEAGVAALGMTALGRFAAPARAADAPKIVVVGAGLAGLNAAYSLRNAGYIAEVHEASDRLGGRCWTLRGAFADGQIAEHGGELIDQCHRDPAARAAARAQARQPASAEQNGTELLGYFDGSPYDVAETTDDIKAAWQKIHADVSAASYPTTYKISTERGRALDKMSIVEWIDETFRAASSRASGSCSTSPTTSSTAPSARAELAQPAVPARLPRPGPVPGLRRVEREVPCRRRQRPDHRPARGEAARPDRHRLGARRRPPERVRHAITLTFAQRSGTKTRDRGQGGARAAVLDPAHVGGPLEGRLRAAEADCDPRAGHGGERQAAGPVLQPFLARPGLNGETFADTGYQDTWEVTRAQPGKPRDPGGLHRRQDRGELGSGTPASRAARVPRPARAGAPGRDEGLERQGQDRLLARQPLDEGLVLLLEGRPVHSASPASREGVRATATSPASTRRSTSRAT